MNHDLDATSASATTGRPPRDVASQGAPLAPSTLPSTASAAVVSEPPLSGYRVVDLSVGVPGAYCGKLLADGGAQVIKIEPPTGDPLRRWSASGATIGGDDDGALFMFLAASKHSVVADPLDIADVERATRLCRSADAVLWSPGSALGERPELGPSALRVAAPHAAIVAISPFGLGTSWSGRPATEFTLQAWSGAIGLRGWRDQPPVSVGGRHGEWVAGLTAAIGLLASWRRSAATGVGELLDVSILECLAVTDHQGPVTARSIAGRPARWTRFNPIPSVEPSSDGWVVFMVVTGQQWLDFCALVGHPEWMEDESLARGELRASRRDQLLPSIRAWTTQHTTDEIVELATLMRIPVAPIGTGATIPAMDHFVERGSFVTNPRGGFLQPDVPYRFHGAHVPRPQVTGAPKLGEHTALHRDPIATPRAAPSNATSQSLPFAGVRIADFTAFWAGPVISQPLAMLGAEVIHIESARRPDGMRLTSTRTFDEDRWWEYAPLFQAPNTAKLDVTFDMSTEGGRELARRLVAHCDVVVENYTPRVMDGWGFGYEALRQVRPDLIMVRAPAYGLSGPWRERTGYAVTMEAIAGLTWITGFPDGEPVAPSNPCDPIAGGHATLALLLALEHRRRTGEGMLVEVAAIGGGLNVAAEQVVEHSHYGRLLERQGNRGPTAAPQNLYLSADVNDVGKQDRWVAVAVETSDQWLALRRALGDPGWSHDVALTTAEGRRAAHDRLDARLREWCSTQSSDAIVEALWNAGVPVATVLLPHEQDGLPPIQERAFFETLEHPVTGPTTYAGFPVRFSAGPTMMNWRPAPLLGEHNREILTGLLGLSEHDVARLESEGIIGDRVEW